MERIPCPACSSASGDPCNYCGSFGEVDLPEEPCDICGMAVVEGELYSVSDGGLTVEHKACVADWFRRNYGREGIA